MPTKLQQVIRLVMVLIRSNRGKSRVVQKGGLQVLLSTQLTPTTYTGIGETDGSECQCWEAFQGKLRLLDPGVRNCLRKAVSKAIDRLSSLVSLCNCPYPDELCRFSDHFGPLRFTHSFQVDQDGQELEIERFLHRFSLVHAQITVIFKERNEEQTKQQVFSAKSTYSMLGRAIAMDSTTFGQTLFSMRDFSSCSRMHPVLGETLPLLLSCEAVEAGLCGDVSVATMAVLGPCMKQYPNWPTSISHIYILVYSPSGVPLMRGESELQLSFLRSLADSLPWGELGLPQVCCTPTHASAQGCLCSEAEFSIENDHAEDPKPGCSRAVRQEVKLEQGRPVEQTLTLFLFLQHNDPFNSQLSDVIANEETLETYLDKVLWYNGDKVRAALRSLLENALKEFLKRKKSSETFQTAMPVILSSLNSIVSSSSNMVFRSACLNSMKVQNTHDLSISLQQTLQRVIEGRFTSRPRCTPVKGEEEAVSEQDSTETCKEGLAGKRAYRGKAQSPLTSKRQRPETIAEDSEASTSSLWEILPPQMMSLFSAPLSEGSGEEAALAGPSSGSLYTTEMKNQEVEREWLQELENLTDWD